MWDLLHNPEAQQAWNQVSDAFLRDRSLSGSIEYGPLCPLEDELRLIADVVGDLSGLAVLDAGCGGGENAVRFARMGADVTALDFSERQLARAREVASEAGVAIRFVLGDIESLAEVTPASQDLIFSANAFPYIEDIRRALASCGRVLKPGARLIASLDHPFRSCFYDTASDDAASSELTNYAEQSYFDSSARLWRFDGTATTMRSYDRPVGHWIDMLRDAGLPLIRLLEPLVPPDILDVHFPIDGPLASLRNIPHTLILVAGRFPAQSADGMSPL